MRKASGRVRLAVALCLSAAAAAATTLVLLRTSRAAAPDYTAKASEAEGGEDVNAREEYLFNRRGLQFGVPLRAYEKAVGQMRAMEAVRAAAVAQNRLTGPPPFMWEMLGPRPIHNELPNYSGLTAGTPFDATGRVSAIAIDPAGRIYVGGANAGVWLSTDHGTTFRTIGDTLPTQSIGSIAIDSVNTNPPTVYVGTGEGNSRRATYYGRGLFSTQDFGAHWNQINQVVFTEGNSDLQSFTTLDARCGVPFAGSGGGGSNSAGGATVGEVRNGGYIFESVNGGSTWHRTFQNPADTPTFTSAAIRTLAPGTSFDTASGLTGPAMFAGLDSTGTAIAEFSCGEGSTLSPWSVLNFPAGFVPAAGVGRSSVAADPNSGRVYGIVGTAAGNLYLGFLRSDDLRIDNAGAGWARTANTPCARTANGGVSWSTVGCGSNVTIDGRNGNFSQAFYDQALAMDPNVRDTVFFGGVGIYESTDAGDTWSFIAGTNGTGAPRTHSDQHAIAFDPPSPTPSWWAMTGACSPTTT